MGSPHDKEETAGFKTLSVIRIHSATFGYAAAEQAIRDGFEVLIARSQKFRNKQRPQISRKKVRRDKPRDELSIEAHLCRGELSYGGFRALWDPPGQGGGH